MAEREGEMQQNDDDGYLQQGLKMQRPFAFSLVANAYNNVPR